MGEFVKDMTMREWYAGQALAGYIAKGWDALQSEDSIAAWCFQMADEMIAAEKYPEQ